MVPRHPDGSGRGLLGWWLASRDAGRHRTGRSGHRSPDRPGPAPRQPEPQPWLLTVAELRRSGRSRSTWRLVEAGDPLGLPGPAAVTSAVVAAGTAVLAPGPVLIPDPAGRADALWRIGRHPSADHGRPIGHAERGPQPDADRDGRTLGDREQQRSDEAALAAIAALRGFAVAPPPGIEPTAAQVADSALRVWWLTRSPASWPNARCASARGTAAVAPARPTRRLGGLQ